MAFISATADDPTPKIPSVIITPLLRHITAHMRAGACLVLLRDPQTDMFQIVATTEDSGLGSVVRPDEDMVSRVALNRQPLIVNHYREWAGRSVEMQDNDIARDALLCVPLLWESRYLGGLVVSAVSKVRQFSADDIPALQTFSPVIAALLQRCTPGDIQPDFEAGLRREVDEEIHELREARRKMAEDADQLRRFLADIVAIQEEERSRIAGDLHDGSNQLIVGAIYEIQVAEQRLTGGRIAEAAESLETAKSLLRKIEADNRLLISGLRPLMLNSHGLAATFRWYLRVFAERYHFEYELNVQGNPLRLSTDVEIVVFRIVQEALNNALEHANARKIHLQISFEPDKLVLIVQDDGQGFDPQAPYPSDHSHLGIISMRERALSIGAQLDIHSSPGTGTRLMLHVPLPPTPEDPLGTLERRHSVQVAYKQQPPTTQE